MEFGIVANAPLLFWAGFAVSLILPFHLPRFGLVIGTIATVFGTVLCLNQNADAFAFHITRELGTAVLVCAGMWLFTACAALVLGHGATRSIDAASA